MRTCQLCRAEPAVVSVGIRYEAGAEFALPARVQIGAVCLELFESRRDRELGVRLSSEFDEVGRGAVVAYLRRCADGVSAIPPEPAAVVTAREQGFVPLREVTGVGDELGPMWPPEHRLWLDELGAGPGEDEYDDVLDRWLVRSPWPSLSIDQTMSMLWRWVERDPYPQDPAAWRARVLEVFGWTESEAGTFAGSDS